MHYRLSIVLILIHTLATAQGPYAVSNIPGELKKDASAVIREYTTNLYFNDVDDLDVEKKKVVTVLERKGLSVLSPFASYDDFTQVKKIVARLYDANGKVVRSFKKKDFDDVSESGSNLYTDNRMLLLRFTPPPPPFTFEMVVNYTTSNTAFLPPFFPVPGYYVSTQKASYTLNNPNNTRINTREFNLEPFKVRKTTNEHVTSYSIQNITCIRPEPLSPYFTEFFPLVKLVPERFHLGGTTTTIKNWDDFAKWHREVLLKDRDQLDPGTVTEIKNLVANIAEQDEKVRAVYQYMQDKTRYISVQVGLGGWQPIPAIEVDKLNYGDCKGLTNYTMALLRSLDIPSYYTIVDSQPGGRDIDQDFIGLQGDHVILTVPLEEETVFLECTDQKLPFNYLGTHTDNRKVLAITPTGARFLNTHSYPDRDNSNSLTATVTFDSSFNASSIITRKASGLKYDEQFRLSELSRDNLLTYYRSHWGHLNNLDLEKIDLQNDKRTVSFTETLDLEFSNYASKAGSRMLLSPNIFRPRIEAPPRMAIRKRPMEIRRGSLETDSIVITLPRGYGVESLFDEIELESKFGTYRASVTEQRPGTLLYKRYLLLKRGNFGVADYNEYVRFMETIAKYDKKRLVINQL